MIQCELLAETTEAHFHRMVSDRKYGFQAKHNGVRALIAKQGGLIRAFNRRGETLTKKLPSHVFQALHTHPLQDFVLDGELMPHNGFFYVFDALWLGQEILTHKPYSVRESRYHSHFAGRSPAIVPVQTARSKREKINLWQQVVESNGEGLVAKNLRAPYREGRADQHWKLKFVHECDVFVIGKRPEHDSVEIGMVDSHGMVHRVSGVSLRGKYSGFPEGTVLRVRFLYSTPDHHIVQPHLLEVRHDKTAAECGLHQLEQTLNSNWKLR